MSTIQFANVEQMMYFLQLYQQYYAAAQTAATPVDIAVGLQFVETGGRVVGGQIANTQISGLLGAGSSYPATTAGQAFAEYVAAGGTTTNTIAATSTGAKQIIANGAIGTTSAGAKVMGLLSMNLPTVAAAIAPLAGVSLGVALYESNPDLWEKISRTLLPFCYEDTELMPIVADENGVTYYPKGAVDAFKSVIEENAISGGVITDTSSNTASYVKIYTSPFPFSFGSDSYVETELRANWGVGHDKYYFDRSYPSVKGLQYTFLCSETPATYRHIWEANGEIISDAKLAFSEYTVEGKKVYVASIYRSDKFISPTRSPDVLPKGTSDLFGLRDKIGYLVLYGSGSKLELGLSKWNGVQYPETYEGVDVVTKIEQDGTVKTETYQPITTPGGQPGVSVESTTPDLSKNQTVVVINPWIVPDPSINNYPKGEEESKPAPLPNQIPQLDPVLDPVTDPSLKPPGITIKPPTIDIGNPNIGNSPPPKLPLIPSIPSSGRGLLHVYNPTQGEIDSFGNWLWTTFSGDLIDTVSKLFNDPMDAVIGLHELYATPITGGTTTIKAGFLDSDVTSKLVSNRYSDINCGSIVVQEYYQNYLDYSPYTKCFIYLPFIGIVPVIADDIIGNAVNITYHIDSYTGCCIAIVTVARENYSSTVYQFEGNCAVEIPITSGYQSTLMSAMMSIAGAALTGTPHVGLAASNLGRANLGKNDVSHSGSFGASYGAMGAKIPYIIVKRPTQKNVVNYNEIYGFPAHKMVVIGNCKGFLRVREVHVQSPTATDEEKVRIEELLKEGVIVQ